MAEELRELRLSKQIPAKDMVAVVQAIYPKYDKTVQSKCENGDAYGVSLRPDAMAALYAHFAPELVESRKTAKKDAHRLTCRISARLETADYPTTKERRGVTSSRSAGAEERAKSYMGTGNTSSEPRLPCTRAYRVSRFQKI